MKLMLAKGLVLAGLLLNTPVCWRLNVREAQSFIDSHGEVTVDNQTDNITWATRVANETEKEDTSPVDPRKCKIKVYSHTDAHGRQMRDYMVGKLLAGDLHPERNPNSKVMTLCKGKLSPFYVADHLRSPTAQLIVAYDFSTHLWWRPRWCGFAVVEHEVTFGFSVLELLCSKVPGFGKPLRARAEYESNIVFPRPHYMCLTTGGIELVDYYAKFGYTTQGAAHAGYGQDWNSQRNRFAGEVPMAKLLEGGDQFNATAATKA